MSRLAADPIERYERLVARTTPANPELTPDALTPIIETAGADPAKEVSALSSKVAEQSGLTVAQAQPVVKAALDKAAQESQTDPTAKASTVSKAVAGAMGASADIELSDPVMLKPGPRVVFAALLFVALVGCVGCITVLGNESSTRESAFVGLAVLGVLALIGILVLVMGYKNVTIKGGAPSTGGSS